MDKFRIRLKNRVKPRKINKHNSDKLFLRNVTLICIDCVNIVGALRSLAICLHYCDFQDIKFLTSENMNFRYRVEIPKIHSKREYSFFVVRELYKYVDTSHLLIVQHDGWICNPKAWDDEWYKYDYIGSNVTWMDNKGGNGGFSFRSKRLLEYGLNIIPEGKEHPEDAAYSSVKKKNTGFRKQFEDAGLRFADRELQAKFGCKNRKKWEGSFGHHTSKLDDWRNPIG